jgi:hypothetical protein
VLASQHSPVRVHDVLSEEHTQTSNPLVVECNRRAACELHDAGEAVVREANRDERRHPHKQSSTRSARPSLFSSCGADSRITLEVSCKAAQAELGRAGGRWGRLVSFSDSLYRRAPADRKGPADRSADAERSVGPRSSRGGSRTFLRAAGRKRSALCAARVSSASDLESPRTTNGTRHSVREARRVLRATRASSVRGGRGQRTTSSVLDRQVVSRHVLTRERASAARELMGQAPRFAGGTALRAADRG